MTVYHITFFKNKNAQICNNNVQSTEIKFKFTDEI